MAEQHDPVDRLLAGYDPTSAAFTPAPGAEVRRRGTRRRHRATALAAAAAVVVIGAVGAPLAVAADRGGTPSPTAPSPTATDPATPVPTSSASRSADPTAIDPSFPLARGLDGAGEGTLRGPSATVAPIAFPDTFCGADLWPASTQVQRLATSLSVPMYFQARELVTFDSAPEAAAVLQDLREALARCDGPRGSAPDQVEYRKLTDTFDEPSDRLDERLTFGWGYVQGLGGSVYEFARVGNAILAAEASGELGLDTLGYNARTVARADDPLVDLMCPYDGTC